MSSTAIGIDKLSAAERLELIEQLWDSLADTHLDLSPEERAELLRRSRELDEDVAAGRPLGRPWAEIRADLVAKNDKR